MEQTQEVAKSGVIIRPNIKAMVKTASGSYHTDDFIGNALAGLTLDQVKEVAAHVGVDSSKYSHLNNGQIRMTLGNQLRKLSAEADVAAAIEAAAAPHREAAAAAAAAKQEAKAAALNARLNAPKKSRKAKKEAAEAA